MNNQFVHLGLNVLNLEDSIKWYENNFGFKKIKQSEKPEFEINYATIQLNDFIIELIQPYNPKKTEKKFKSLTKSFKKIPSTHIALNVKDIRATYKKLRENSVVTPVTEFNEKFFFCQDLNGYLIEIREKN